jgi:undecaprenyl-diphosphatase
MISNLDSWDQKLFQLLNGTHNEFFDVIMPWISNKYIWIPLYGFILYGLVKYTNYRFIEITIAIIVLIFFSDYMASGIIKPLVGRLRPCYEPALEGMVHLLKGCGGKFGFASSHASNSFATAIFSWLLLKDKFPSTKWLILWAALVAYSRIYLGVHYPGDVITGALIGWIAALLSRALLIKFAKVKMLKSDG